MSEALTQNLEKAMSQGPLMCLEEPFVLVCRLQCQESFSRHFVPSGYIKLRSFHAQGGRQPKGKCDERIATTKGSQGGFGHPPFLCPSVARIGMVFTTCSGRFSFSSPPSIWRRVDGARTRGTGPLRCGYLRGLFLWSREVPSKVWLDLWVEILSQVVSSSLVVSCSPIWPPTESP